MPNIVKKSCLVLKLCHFKLQCLYVPMKIVRYPTIMVITVWNLTMFQYRSDSRQLKRNVISCIANLVYELPHKLPNDLRLMILENKEILGKTQIQVETQPSAQSLFQKLKSSNSSGSVESKKKNFRLSWSKYFGTFQYFSTDAIHHT